MEKTDKITARILVIALTFLATIGLAGTLYLIAVNPDSNQVSTFVALAGVPIGAVAALSTTRNNQNSTESPVIINATNPPAKTINIPPGSSILKKDETLLDEMAESDSGYSVPPSGF